MPTEQKPYAVLPLLEFRQFAVALVIACNSVTDDAGKRAVQVLLNQFSDLQKLETVLWKLADTTEGK